MKINNIDNGQKFDFGKTSKEYAKYRDIYPKELFEKLLALNIGVKDSKLLDLGTGTGVIPRGLAKYGAKISATDISENQIAEAKKLSSGIKNINYKVCPAENTGFADNSFDAITACQCFWYFDPNKIVPEIKRMIVSGGIFAKVYMTWLDEDSIANASQNLIRKLNPNWNSGEMSLKDLNTHYFENPTTDNFTVDLPFTKESWHGRMLSCRGVLGSMDDKTVKKFEEEHSALLTNLPDSFTIRHKIFITYYKIEK